MVNQKPARKVMLKVGILSVSLMIQAASAISVAVTGMSKSFSGHSATSVQALVTIPSFSIMLFILLSNWIIRVIGKRNTVFLGTIVALVGGIGPAFTTSFVTIEVLRFLFGAGTGIYTSLCVSLIGDSFTGDEQRNLLGMQSAIATFGSSLATFIAGILVGISWQSSYLVYFLLLPVIILFAIGYPKQEQHEKATTDETVKTAAKSSHKLPGMVIIGILILFVYFNAVMAMYTNSGLALQQMNVPGQGMLGTSLAVAGLIGGVITMLYGPIYKVLKHATPIVVCLVGAIGFFGMANATNMWIFTISIVLVTGTSLLVPYVYGVIMDSVPESSKNFAISAAMVFNNLGAYFSPYTLSFLGKSVNHTDPVTSFVICAGIMIALGVVLTFVLISRNKHAISKNNVTVAK
ncbi:MFS transporter [Lactiplantibacillus pentosus]|uniref:MFS transporter n=1 Tax=Lactiplantibacillus pentosus TaxID=1589 RepID=A0AB37REL3_LACPE|nr:MFS transporter [Lactiplantibacillus pentosus]RMW42376.1 MFS transporter [Lactiplantibacillus pentosus]RMW48454.1 MFS transporter [Lactiplantibacillus pentosus]RMW52591.1 MFS transporter [Lactiplantibacillus pentosus]RMW55325.1 MFS transporter [Lactiplantibacillus pentosus]